MKRHPNRFFIGTLIVLALGWSYFLVSAPISSAGPKNEWSITQAAGGPSTSDLCKFLGVDSATFDLQLPPSVKTQIRVETWQNGKSVDTWSQSHMGIESTKSLSLFYKPENDNLSVMIVTPWGSSSKIIPRPAGSGQLNAKSTWSVPQLKLQEKEIPFHAVFYNKDSITSPTIDGGKPESVLDSVKDYEGAVVFFVKVTKAEKD
ncbi:MAG: hypothetical protein HZA51_17735 [Planctomycetes bacterium]|nr:hypothetical protein [Planctomycetota bacterium]